MSSPFHYRGTLEETALPEMFFTIFRHRVPGLIDISRDGVTKRIYIQDGNVLHASSTDRADRLGAYLYRTGKLSRQDLERTIRKLAGSSAKHGQIMIEEGLLSPGELYEAIRGQMESIIWSVFSWQEGEVSFRIGEFNEPTIKIHLPMRQVILRGIKRAPDTKSLIGRLGRKQTVLRPCYCTEDLIEIAIDLEEYALLRLVDGKRTIYDVCTEGPFNVSENARLLYAFYVLQMVERVEGDGRGVTIRLDADKKVAS
ncbi:MAG: DUF4388 domain-containing protein [Acidobacteria bacterium]|nr:MAG: DUF4388 domain-containing protein [Acidobacteriota bacterium]